MKAVKTRTRWHALLLAAMIVGVLSIAGAVGAGQYLASPGATASGYSSRVHESVAIAAGGSGQNAPLLDTFDRATAFLQSYHNKPADELTDLSDRHSPEELLRIMGWTSR